MTIARTPGIAETTDVQQVKKRVILGGIGIGYLEKLKWHQLVVTVTRTEYSEQIV
jgi:hypothetical protein